MRKIFAVALAGLLLTLLGQSPAPSQTGGKKVEKLMKAKLKHSQVLLEGIAVGDFKKISASAEELLQLTKTEEWLMYKTPRYQMHSNDFQRRRDTHSEGQRQEHRRHDTGVFRHDDVVRALSSACAGDSRRPIADFAV